MIGFRSKILQKWISVTKNYVDYDFDTLFNHQQIIRPNYAYCMLNAAILAERLGMQKLSILEFGVAGGNGLLAIEYLADKIQRHLDNKIEFEIYGFDTGEGLPELEGIEDLPYWFQPAQYKMDVDRLRAKLNQSNLVIGNVRDTVSNFFQTYSPAPVGVMFCDLDYHSSTRDSFKIFDQENCEKYFMPRIHMYMDDVMGQQFEMYGEFNGQLLAMKEFNESHADIKMHLNQNLLRRHDLDYRYQIYYAHLFKHKEYSKFVGGDEKAVSQNRLKLKS